MPSPKQSEINIKSAKGMAQYWQGQNKRPVADWLDLFYHGRTPQGTKIPNAMERQEKLVEIAITAAIETIIYQDLEEGASLEYLRRHHAFNNPARNSAAEADLLTSFNEYTHELEYICGQFLPKEEAAADKTQAICNFIKQLQAQHFIKQPDDFLEGADKETQMLDYQRRINYSVALREKADQAQRAFDDGLEDFSTTSVTGRNREQIPEVPRVVAFKTMFGHEIDIRDTGCKGERNAADKLLRESKKEVPADEEPLKSKRLWRFLLPKKAEPRNAHGGVSAASIRDINRITIVPKTPRLADIYSRMLYEHNYAQGEGRGCFVEGWQASKYGCVDRKAYVAIASDEQYAQHLRGMVGEVKIESAEMLKADMLSHESYEFLKLLESDGSLNPAQLIGEYNKSLSARSSAQTVLGKLPAAISMLSEYYVNKQKDTKIDFAATCPTVHKYARQYRNGDRTPPLQEDDLKKIFAEVLHLNDGLYKNAARSCDREWALLYFGCVLDKVEELCEAYDEADERQKLAVIEKLKAYAPLRGLREMLTILKSRTMQISNRAESRLLQVEKLLGAEEKTPNNLVEADEYQLEPMLDEQAAGVSF